MSEDTTTWDSIFASMISKGFVIGGVLFIKPDGKAPTFFWSKGLSESERRRILEEELNGDFTIGPQVKNQ